jgi:hypothetical protein
MRWSERVALVSSVLDPVQHAKAVARYIASVSAETLVERDAEDSPLGQFARTRKITRRPLHNRGRMRQSNG